MEWSWAPAALVGVLSFLLNLANFLYTRYSSRKARERQLRLEEFRSQIREPLSRSIADLETTRRDLSRLVDYERPVAELRTSLYPENKKIIEILGVIEDTLMDANRSPFADGDNWLEGFDGLRDSILAKLDRSGNTARPDAEVIASVRAACSDINDARSLILRKINDQFKRF